MKQIKDHLHSEWQMMDLREPSKINRIEISCYLQSITILQKLYIELILKWEGLNHANPVRMPLDPNIHPESNLKGNTGN